MDIDCRFALSTSEAWDLSTLTHKLKTILEHLKKQMEECVRYIGKPVLYCVIEHAMPYIKNEYIKVSYTSAYNWYNTLLYIHGL